MGTFCEGIKRRYLFGKAWLHDGKPLWLWLCFAVFLFGPVWADSITEISHPLPNRLRWSGMVFQFAGLLTVIVGLNSSRKLFDRDPIWKAILNWLGEARYIIKPKELVKVKSSGTAAISVEGTGKGTVVSNSEKSLDERVQRLEDQLEQLESQLWETKKDLQERDKELKTELAKEQQERQSDSLKIREQIETAAIGGIHIELAGIAYLFLGIALATIPNEIASLLS